MPAGAVQRGHELRAEALSVGMLLGDRLQLADEGRVTAETEVGVDALFEHGQPQLLEPFQVDSCRASRATSSSGRPRHS